ncbi:MAG: isoprenyl transferase [Rhodospirillales bacterium]|nr:isoprenyl transferase [Rhodospirillales bacterium]
METASLSPANTPPPPVHVAIIMDGNGRWARARGLPRIEGHRRSAEAVRRTIRAAAEAGISYLTLFGFSSENWKRPLEEISDLMGLLRYYLGKEVAELHKNGVRFKVIGDRSRLDPDIVTMIVDAERHTANNTGLTFILALSYGARAELVSAVRSLASDVQQGTLSLDDIDEETVSQHLFTKDIPDPDLLIRTSGERRISNFLLWQLAYAEFVFMDVLWPDFDASHLQDAVADFCSRERRFGDTR